MSISSITFNQVLSTITLNILFFQDIINQNLIIDFTPNQTFDLRFYLTLNSSASMKINYVFISESSIKTAKMISILSYVIVISSWISFIIGLILRRLAGLEVMVTVHFVFFTIVWLNQTFLLPFPQTYPLKFSVGCNLNIFTD
jgi:hypothetical protein